MSVSCRREKSDNRAIVRTVCAVLLCWICLSIDRPVLAGQPVQLHAIIVGVTKFQDSDIRPLSLAAKDAGDFRDFLLERKNLFSDVHITMLLDDRATRANVAEALRDKLKNAAKHDIVILYFSGHGVADPDHPGEFYFVTHDARVANLFGTALLMNDPRLFAAIGSQRLLMISDACHAAGFIPGIEKVSSKQIICRFPFLEKLEGRRALASSRGDELSYEEERFGNSIFTHFLLKGLRGEADCSPRDGNVTIEELYSYVYDNTKAATGGKQSPQLYPAAAKGAETSIFHVPTFKEPLHVDVSFAYVDENDLVRPLTNGSNLRSGDLVGVSFRPECDCFVYVLWLDSAGRMGHLFPNTALTDGDTIAKAGKRYWLPVKNEEQPEERWYVLDDNPGEETLYFVASRERNTKLEELCDKLDRTKSAGKDNSRAKSVSKEVQRAIHLMGFAPETKRHSKVLHVEGVTPDRLFDELKDTINVSGADLVYKVTFKHLLDRDTQPSASGAHDQ